MVEPINSTISPWFPEQNQIQLAVLGKLIEELNEAGSRAARCIIQGIDELDPETKRTNREELSRELSDVMACIEVAGWAGVEIDYARQMNKVAGYSRWHGMILDRKTK